MTIDTQAIKERIDLVDLISRDVRLKKVASTRGGEWAGACPWCGGRDRFHVQRATGLWRCRQCSPEGRWQDACGYVMRRDGVSFVDACRVLGASDSELGAPARQHRRQEPVIPLAQDMEPTDGWRARAAAFVDLCAATLWSDAGERARAYLIGRGLQEETLRVWRIGLQPDEHRYESAAAWGLDGGRVWLPRGIVLPWLAGERVWQLKVRTAARNPDDRYKQIRGGHPLLYGADTLVPGQPAVLLECEFDTLLVWQAMYDRAGAVSLGSAGRGPTRLGALLLAQATPLLVAYDSDAAGDDGAEKLRKLAPRVRRIRTPIGKDVGEFVEAGGRVKAWITFELARLKAGMAGDA